MTNVHYTLKLSKTGLFQHTNHATKKKEEIEKKTTIHIELKVPISNQLEKKIKTAFAEGQQNQEFKFCTDIAHAFITSVPMNIIDCVQLDDSKNFATYVISETLKPKPVSCCFSKPVQTEDHFHDIKVKNFIRQSIRHIPPPSTAS